MDVEILIHGVPNGHDYYGPKEEQNNAGSFYITSQESIKFIVEIKKNGNTPYVYYSYLRYKGVIGAEGRSGSYFGLTLRLDEYYNDILHAYNMLDMVFKKYVLGSLLIPTGETYEYNTPDFASKKSDIERLQQGLIQLIQSTCVASKFIKIDNSFINPISNAPICNIADITDGIMLSTLKKHSKVILSPDYKSNLEKEYEKKMQDAENRSNSVVAERDKKISEKDTTISSLNNTIKANESKIASLEQDIKQKNQELSQHKQKGDIAQLVERIKDPIVKLSEYFRIKEEIHKPKTNYYGKKNFIIGIINGVLTILVLTSILLVHFVKFPTGGKSGKKNDELMNLKTELVNLKQQIKEKDAVIFDLRKTSEQDASQKVNLKIDISGFNGGNLSATKNYKVRIKEGANTYTGKGSWSIINATITKGKATDNEIEIRPTGKGEVEIAYNVSSYKVENSPRIISVEGSTSGTENSLEILISPNDEEVELGKEYTFSVKGYNGQGTWRVHGFEIKSHTPTRAIVKVIKLDDNTPEKATISYTPEGGKKVTKQFKYKKQ
ncbi:MAG: hypothetical protein IJY67_09350 [Paludibacteraceae bacterium]|nr:hypothetical protein [Paludibacteraceae bacterium]